MGSREGRDGATPARRAAATDFFWDIAEPLLLEAGVDEGTLMGFPCLRVDGNFFATCDHRSGELIVKLARERVSELVESGVGQPFAPAGRVFKEWVLVPERDEKRWANLIAEAREFCANGP